MWMGTPIVREPWRNFLIALPPHIAVRSLRGLRPLQDDDDMVKVPVDVVKGPMN